MRGERFRDEVGAAYQQMIGAVECVRDEWTGLDGTLRLGLLTPVADGEDLPAITSAFERKHPDCRVEVSLAPYGEAFDCLRHGDLDLLASWLPHGQTDLVNGPTLTHEPRVLAVADDHPLTVRGEVSLEDIADYHVPPIEQIHPKDLAEAWIPRKTPSGRAIRRLHVRCDGTARRDAGQLLNQISWWLRSGGAVYPTMATVRAILGPGIAYLPIVDMPSMCSALVWPRGTRDPRIPAFARFAQQVRHAKGLTRTRG